MKEETLKTQSTLSIPVLSRGKERFISLYLLWSILDIPIFSSPKITSVLPREPELKARKEVEKVRTIRSFRSHMHTLTMIFFSTVLQCSFNLGKTVFSQNNKQTSNRVTQSTWSQTRDRANFVIKVRESRHKALCCSTIQVSITCTSPVTA